MPHFLRPLFLSGVRIAYGSAIGTEFGVFAIEKHILTETAFQGTVVERYLHRWLEAYLCKLFVAESDYPGVPACEICFQSRSDATVEHVDVLGPQTLAIGRIGDEYPLGRVVCPFRHRLAGKFHHVVDSRRLDVSSGYAYGFRIDVSAVDLIGIFPLCGIIVVYLLEKFLVEIRPFLKSEMLAVDARVYVGRDKGCLHQESTGATHRIDEVGVAPPAGLHDYAGGEHLVDGSIGRFRAVASFRERLAAGVERYGDPVVGYVHVELDVGSGETYRRPFPIFVVEMVGDSVFHPVGHKLGMGEIGAVHGGVDREGGVDRHELFPIEVAHVVV